LLLEELDLPGFGTNSAGYLGTCRLNAADVMLTIAERQLAMATLLRLAEKYNAASRQTPAHYLKGAHGAGWRRQGHRARQPFPIGSPYRPAAARTTKSRARRWRIVPCSMLAHSELGRINQDSLLEVWQHSPALKPAAPPTYDPADRVEFCAGCSYIPYCTGNCPGLAYTITAR